MKFLAHALGQTDPTSQDMVNITHRFYTEWLLGQWVLRHNQACGVAPHTERVLEQFRQEWRVFPNHITSLRARKTVCGPAVGYTDSVHDGDVYGDASGSETT